MKRLLLFCTACLLTLAATAIPARPGQWKTIRLADGTEVRAQLCGDEFMRFWQTADGECYVQDGAVFRTADMQLLTEHASELRQQMYSARKDAKTFGDESGLYTGKKKGIVILAEFTDLKFQEKNTREYIETYINTPGYTDETGFRGSVNDYFKEQSNGKFDLTFDVVGPVQLEHDYAYYGANVPVLGSDTNPRIMVKEACNAAAALCDLSAYDWNGDGEVEEVFIIYAGKGEADGGNANTIWPHKGEVSLTVRGMRIKVYACTAELNGSGKTAGIGTLCHEYSHCMGLPDLYDTNYSGNYGMMHFDIMCHGAYAGGGYRPSGYSSICKYMSGWLTPVELKDEPVEVTALQPLSAGGDAYIIRNDAFENEFYLVESRQAVGFDDSLYGTGLLILYVDYDKSLWDANIVNSTSSVNPYQHCTIFHADNSAGTGSYDEYAGDPYPYNGNNELSVSSMPRATINHPNKAGDKLMHIAITDITQNADGTMSFKYAPAEPNAIDPTGATFYETFDKCDGTGGNDQKWSGNIASAELTADYEGWEYGNGTAYGANQCARFGTSSKQGVVTTPKFAVDGAATLTFRVAPWGNDDRDLTLAIATGEAVITGQAQFTMSQGFWDVFTTTIEGNGEVQVTFTPAKRFFLDDVIVKPAEPSAIKTVRPTVSDGRIYTLTGRYVGNDLTKLLRGIYIRDGRKVVK